MVGCLVWTFGNLLRALVMLLAAAYMWLGERWNTLMALMFGPEKSDPASL